MSLHREANAELVGRKIFVMYSSMRRPPTVFATKGRHRAQSMIVSGTEENPAYAVINIRLRNIPEGR